MIGELETKASVSGYPDNTYHGYHSIEECVDAWQSLCRWGIHPHPVDPQFVKTPGLPAVKHKAAAGTSLSLKQLCTPAPAAPLPPSPRKVTVNYAIRGGGIVSSSAERTEGHYRELQEQGEEPDLIITRSLQAASLFVLEEEEGS
ncbi:hypothetical protein B0H14DRAFT_3476787 [Mycena olivaceomarginata]|nr:hypothetical protein B0H14DRAFT_3476787 [Mycena olivaceomarginata]